MTQAVKLNHGQKHLLRLVSSGIADGGWATVGALVYPLLEREIPAALIEMERDQEDGPGRVRLTAIGQNLIESMEWL